MTITDIGPQQPDQQAEFLGDGLFAQFDGWQIELFAHNGISKTNSVFLEPGVLNEFLQYVQRLRDR